MSLIICPECQHEVSSKAPTCPHCGVAIADNIKRCPVCNTYVLMAAHQCPNCNTKFVVDDNLIQQDSADTEQDALTDEQTDNEDLQPEVLSQNQEERSKKQGSSAPWWLLILAILAIAIGGFFYWENQNQEKAEEQAFILLENCNNPLNFEDFIARFPNSPHINDVRSRLQELRSEEAKWLEISHTSDVSKIEDFVHQHPNSPYSKAALQKIDSLDWREANRIGSRKAYERYIQKHDNGEFLNEAYAAMDAARAREERARLDSIAAATEGLADEGISPSAQ